MELTKRIVFAFAFVLVAVCAVPDGAAAQQYHGVTHHRVSRRASRMHRPGWHHVQHHQQQQGVPEFDPHAAGSAFALLIGGLAVLVTSRDRTSIARG